MPCRSTSLLLPARISQIKTSGSKHGARGFDVQPPRRRFHFRGQPSGPRLDVIHVLPAGRVLLGHAVERGMRSGPKPEQRRPKPRVHEGALAVDELADQHVRRFSHGAESAEDFMRLRMSPPAAADALAGDRLGQAAASGGDDDAALLDVPERIHRASLTTTPPFITKGTRSRMRTSCNGSPLTAIRSA